MGGRGECNTLKPRPLPSLTGLRFVLFVSRGCTRYAVLPLPTLYRPPGSKFRSLMLANKSEFITRFISEPHFDIASTRMVRGKKRCSRKNSPEQIARITSGI